MLCTLPHMLQDPTPAAANLLKSSFAPQPSPLPPPRIVLHPLQTGFSGTLLYVSPSMLQALAADADVASLVREGKLLLLLWDRFSKYQRVVEGQVRGVKCQGWCLPLKECKGVKG